MHEEAATRSRVAASLSSAAALAGLAYHGFFMGSPGFAAAGAAGFPALLGFVRQYAFSSLPVFVLVAATQVHPAVALQAVSSRPLHLEAALRAGFFGSVWVAAAGVTAAALATGATATGC
jgi:hypothetical protein